jgi:flagellar basal-body rod protein FlgG
MRRFKATTLFQASSAIAVISVFLANFAFEVAADQPATPNLPLKSKPSEIPNKSPVKAVLHKRLPSESVGNESRGTMERALQNYETILSVIANNIANADTPGFKRSRAIVEDQGYRQESQTGVADASGQFSPSSFSVGAGSQIVGTEVDFRQGNLEETGRELDVAIEGHGFFQVKDPSGEIVYTRAGHLALNASGTIVIESAKTGRILSPEILIPQDATGITISSNGKVFYRTPTCQTLQTAGQIQMANFINSQGLLKMGENLYQETDGSGTCQLANPETCGVGKLRQGWIEKSNVDLREEMIEWKHLRQLCRAIHSLLDGD